MTEEEAIQHVDSAEDALQALLEPWAARWGVSTWTTQFAFRSDGNTISSVNYDGSIYEAVGLARRAIKVMEESGEKASDI